MNKEPAQIMVVAAHPDDPEFGAAGTVAKWIREGKSVVYVVCTSGDKGTSDPNITSEELAKIREEEELSAARVLGVREVIFLRHPDQSLEDTPEFRKEIVRWIRIFRPEIVLTPDPYRRYLWHRDHRVTGLVTMDAVYPYARDRLAYPDLLKEGLQPYKVKEMLFWGADDPNYFVDVTDTFDLKITALRCHKSQIGPDAEEWVKDMAKSHAEGKGFELAEAFYRVEIPW